MPADGQRKKVLVGVRTAIKAATGVDYFFDWSPAGVAELGRDSLEVLLGRSGAVTARIRDGVDSHVWRGNVDVTANFEVLVDLVVRSPTSLVQKLNDAIADISLAIGKSPSAGGASTMIRFAGVDPPIYDVDSARGAFAVATLRLRTTYDYTVGLTR